MTRVNVVPVEELSTKHLTAEYREIPRLVTYVRRALETNNVFDILSKVPDDYCLGKGHVKFFSDKLGYIRDRHDQIKNEGIKRGYKYNAITIDLQGIPDRLCKGYEPTENSLLLNRNRIKERTK